MENSVDGDTDCSEKCPTDRCLLLDKRDKQATINVPDDEGDDGDDEDDDEDENENERIIIGKSINQQKESRSVVIIPNTNGELYSLSTTNGNHDNLTVNHHNEIDNKSEHNQHQQGNNQINSLDQMNPSESHNHSENDLSDLVAKSKRFPRLNKEKKISDQDEVINNNDSTVNRDALNSMVNSSSSSPKSLETCLHPNGIVTNNLINNIHPHTLNINISNPGNHFYCPNNNNYHNYGACNGKSLNSSKCVRRLISSDSGGSNKSSSKSGRKSRSGGPPQSPPDGGWGWVVVFASFMISLIADGVSLSYGFFQMDLSEHFGQSKGKTALVGSLLLSMPALTGPIASALTDRYGCRSMTIVSGLLSASGFILGSFARSLEHLFIAFSITGIGLSLSYVTSIVIVAYYFNTKRSFATGLAVCGTGIGTFLFAPLTTYLLKEFSWRGTLLIMSGFFLNIIVFGALMRDINVSEVDSISGQESDSDEDSVIEPLGRTCNNTIGCSCGFQQNNLKSGCGANNLILNGSQCSTIDVNNRNSFPLNQTSSPNTEKFHLSNRLSEHHYDKLTSNNNNNAPTKSSSSSSKPLSSICINSHCSSSILPNDEQLSNYEAHCKVTKLFHEPDHHNQCNHHQVYAHNHHHHQCNHHLTNNRRFQRFQSSYSSTKPKSDLKNYSSLVNIPTYITTDSSVSKDVLDEISGRKDGNLNQLLQKYPDLLSNLISRDQEKSLFLSSGVIGQNDCIGKDQVKGQPIPIPETTTTTTTTSFISKHNKNDHSTVNSYKVNDSSESRPRRFRGVGGDPESGLSVPTRNTVINVNRLKVGTGNNLIGGVNIGGGTGKDGFGSKLQRASLTYRTAVFRDVRRYRLRSSSAPDIYTNSMVTIAERESFLQDIKQVIVDSVDLSIFKNVRFAIFCFSNLLLHGCIDVPYVYLPDHAISSGICVKEMAFYLISVLGIANTLGTIIVGYIGDKPWLRPSTWYSGLTALGGISMALIPMARNYYLLAVLAAFYGFSVSANYTLVSVILVEIISLDKFTNAYGLMLLVQGIGTMLGPPIAGWLFDISGDYDTTFYVIGLCVLASGIIVFPLNESLSLASSSSSATSSSSSSSSKGSSMTESPSRTSSPVEDKITVLSSNKTLFDKEPLP